MKIRRLKIILTIILMLALCFTISLGGCKLLMKDSWKRAYGHFINEPQGYQRIKVIIDDIESDEKEPYRYLFDITVDAEDYEMNYKTDETYANGSVKWIGYLNYYNSFRFNITPSNGKIAYDNGFFDDVQVGTEVIIDTHYYYGWTGWTFPIMSLQVGDKVYLDYETGKENWLNYIRANM